MTYKQREYIGKNDKYTKNNIKEKYIWREYIDKDIYTKEIYWRD